MCDRSRVHCPDSSPGTAGSGPPPNHVVAAAVSGRRVSIMETNINEPNTTYSADKVLLDRFNQPIKYEGNPAPDVPKVVDRFASLHPDSADGPVSYVMPRDL